ncbi:MAG: type 4a pilus biogenesis protein PilO [Candidatus Omnitrophota bacterium]
MHLADIEQWKNKALNLGIIILAFVIAFNIYKEQAKEIAVLNEKKDSESKKIPVLNEIAQWEKKLSVYKGFIDNKEISSVMNTVSNIAEDSAAKITSIRPAGSADYPLYTKYSFSLTVLVEGYHALGRFTSKLESHSNIYNIDSVVIRQQVTQQDGKVYKMAVDLNISTVFMKN